MGGRKTKFLFNKPKMFLLKKTPSRSKMFLKKLKNNKNMTPTKDTEEMTTASVHSQLAYTEDSKRP